MPIRRLIPLFAFAFFLAATLGWGQSGTIVGQAVAPTFAAPNPTIQVCPYIGGSGLPCSPLSNLYSDSAFTIPIANPFTGDQYGNYSFFAAAGLYIVQVTPILGTTYSYLYTVQNGATNFVTGSGTVNTLPKWNGIGTSLGNSSVSDNGSTVSTGLTLTLNGTVLAGSGSGSWTLRATTDNVVGAATTDTFTGKTFDTAGSGNVFKINGTGISAVTGTGAVVLATAPSLSNVTLTGTVTAPSGSIAASDITPGLSSQCLITTGGVSTWGSCSGQSAVTLVNSDLSVVTSNTNTTLFQPLHTYSFASGSRNFNGARFHSQSWLNITAVNTSESVNVALLLSDGTHSFTTGTFAFTPGSTSSATCCTIIVDVDCTVQTAGSPATIYCGVKAAGQNVNTVVYAWFGRNGITNVNSAGVLALTEQISFSTASTSNTVGGNGFFCVSGQLRYAEFGSND